MNVIGPADYSNGTSPNQQKTFTLTHTYRKIVTSLIRVPFMPLFHYTTLNPCQCDAMRRMSESEQKK